MKYYIGIDLGTSAMKLYAAADVIKPEPELVAKYEVRYQQFKKIYPACKQLFAELH